MTDYQASWPATVAREEQEHEERKEPNQKGKNRYHEGKRGKREAAGEAACPDIR